jgi:RDD family
LSSLLLCSLSGGLHCAIVATIIASTTDEPCPHCGRPLGKGRFCLNCDVLRTDADGTVVRAPRLTRLAAFVVDLALIVVTLGVGYLAWFAMTAREGQSPGKRFLGLRVINRDGTVASPGKMWLRLGVTILASGWLDPAVALFNRDAKTLHDFICRTLVVNAAGSEKLLTRRAFAVSEPVAYEPAHTPALTWEPAPAPEPEAPPDEPSKPAFDPDQVSLRRLDYLHSQKLISDREYEDRRAAVLERMGPVS